MSTNQPEASATDTDVKAANEKLVAVRKELADRVVDSAEQLQRLGDVVAHAVGLDPVSGGEVRSQLDDMGSKLYVAGVHQLELASTMVSNIQKLATRLLDTIDSSSARVLRIVLTGGGGGHVFFDFRNTTMGVLESLALEVEVLSGKGFTADDFELLLGRTALGIGQATSVCVQLAPKERPASQCTIAVSIRSGDRKISSRDVEVWVRP